MDPTIPYLACVVGAVALVLLLRQGRRPVRAVGALLGIAAFGALVASSVWLFGAERKPNALYLLFSLIAVASAVRMVTHHRPVYSVLYFIMVVLSSAGLFLLMEAEFMAFALVIVYAGAILITYMFVLMLATEAADPRDESALSDYDRMPREPVAAAVVGFIMLALLTNMIFEGVSAVPPAPTDHDSAVEMAALMNTMPRESTAVVQELAPGAQLKTNVQGHAVFARGDEVFATIVNADGTSARDLVIPAEHLPTNIQQVGHALVGTFPVSLEVAGIILLMAMFGAVVLARRQIELNEDELREAAGLRPFAFHADTEPKVPVAVPGSRVPAGGVLRA